MLLNGQPVFEGKNGRANVEEFWQLVANYRFAKFYFPNHKEAPWHVQAKFGNTVVNFYPHKLKMYGDGHKSVQLKSWPEAYDQLSEWAEELPEAKFEVIDDGD